MSAGIRTGPRRAVPPEGGGNGGGPDGRDREESLDGGYHLNASDVSLCARAPMPPALPGGGTITILAAGLGFDGHVDVRGSQGVRITAGPAPGLTADSAATNGVEVAVGQAGSLKLHRGLLPVDQKVELTPAGITVDAGAMPVTITSLGSIELSVGGGLTKIRLGPEGVTIEAISIRLSATLQTQIQGVLNTISASGINKVGGPLTMIG